MRPRTSVAALATALTLLGGGTAAATTGAAGSGIAADVQYQPEDTGTVPVTPPVETPATPPTTEQSVSPPTTPTTPVTPQTPATPPQTPKQHEGKATPAAPSQTPTTEPIAQTTPNATPVAESSSLPFTGFDLIPVAIAGLALLAVGAVLRRHGRSDRS